MSQAVAPSGRADRSAAIRDQLTRLLSARLQHSALPCEIVPGDLLQGVTLRLIETRPIKEADRIEVLAEAAPILRQVLAQTAGRRAVHFITGLRLPQSIEAFRLDEALRRLEAADPALARMIEARCYGGLLPEQQPAMSELPVSEVQRRWRIARAWLQDALTPEEN